MCKFESLSVHFWDVYCEVTVIYNELAMLYGILAMLNGMRYTSYVI